MRTLISNILRHKFFNNNVTPLGRWKIDYCDKMINRKLDMSNEDHCGPCGTNSNFNSINNNVKLITILNVDTKKK